MFILLCEFSVVLEYELIILCLIFQHKVAMCKNVQQRFKLNYLMIPLSWGIC